MHIPESSYGVAGANFNITSGALQWTAGIDPCALDVAKGSASDGRMPGFDSGSNPQQVFGGGNRLRIDMFDDANDAASVGINVAQSTPGSSAPGSTPESR